MGKLVMTLFRGVLRVLLALNGDYSGSAIHLSLGLGCIHRVLGQFRILFVPELSTSSEANYLHKHSILGWAAD